MNVDAYLGLVPQITTWVKAANLDALVLGLGPTGWLARALPRKLTQGLRIFTAHDGGRLGMAIDDLVILDGCEGSPKYALAPSGERYRWIVGARPKRLWIHAPSQPEWDMHIHECMRSVMRPVQFYVWPGEEGACTGREDFRLGTKDQPHTFSVSPTGCSTLAWSLGCRRIGVLGMDLVRGQTPIADNEDRLRNIDAFMSKIAAEAEQQGGAILNLSPITSLEMFKSGSTSRLLATA